MSYIEYRVQGAVRKQGFTTIREMPSKHGTGKIAMSNRRKARLRQYRKIAKYCHKRLVSRPMLARAVFVTINNVRNRAVDLIFDNCKRSNDLNVEQLLKKVGKYW